ncbi:hypothetical protein V8E53_013860 [Lactarius tabidus]
MCLTYPGRKRLARDASSNEAFTPVHDQYHATVCHGVQTCEASDVPQVRVCVICVTLLTLHTYNPTSPSQKLSLHLTGATAAAPYQDNFDSAPDVYEHGDDPARKPTPHSDDNYRLLNQLVSDTSEALGKIVRIMTWFRAADGNVAPPPMKQEEMREIGFDGYAIDFVDCAPAMRSFFTRDCQFHRTYGRRLPQNLTHDLRPARTPSTFAKGRDQLAMCADEGRRLSELDREIKKEQSAHKEATDKVKPRQKAVAEEKSRVQKVEYNFKFSLLKVTRQRVDIAQQYAKLVRDTINDQAEATVRGLEHLQQSSRKHALEVLLDELDSEYQMALADFNTANGVYVMEKEHCKELLDTSKAKLDEVDEELRNTFKGMEGTAHERTADELKDELGALRERLQMLLNTDPGVIKQYERRKEAKIEDRERAAAKVDKSMKVARDNWQPASSRLSESGSQRLSTSPELFSGTGCAGELQLTPHWHDDYEKWAITVYSRFLLLSQLSVLPRLVSDGGYDGLSGPWVAIHVTIPRLEWSRVLGNLLAPNLLWAFRIQPFLPFPSLSVLVPQTSVSCPFLSVAYCSALPAQDQDQSSAQLLAPHDSSWRDLRMRSKVKIQRKQAFS